MIEVELGKRQQKGGEQTKETFEDIRKVVDESLGL